MAVDPTLLTKIEFFRLLNDADRQTLAGVVHLVKLQPGDTLFRTGEVGESLFVVHTGEVELFVKDLAGQKIVLRVAKADDYFGEIALLDAGPRSATALALTSCELIELDSVDLLPIFQRQPDAALHMLAAMARMTRQADELLQARVSRNVNDEMEMKLTWLQRLSDWLAVFAGSMTFLFLHAGWFIIWIAINTLPVMPCFDPFPFGLLTMIVSLEAIFLSCFVLISQNRQAEKDRVRSDIEYEVNIKAELEITHLHQKTDQIYEEMMRRFACLEKMFARLPTSGSL